MGAGNFALRPFEFAARYLGTAGGFGLIWEIAQLPLYTIWDDAPRPTAFLAALHCSAGDVLISAGTLGIALLFFGRGWPVQNYARVAVGAIIMGVLYTIFSEWLNVGIRATWTYSPLMPTLPWIGTGLAPLLQWVAVPLVSFQVLRSRVRH